MRLIQLASKHLLTAALIALYFTGPVAAEKMPAERAGTIGAPTGKIAFVRESNIWAMNADGSEQRMVCQSNNADGRISWDAESKRIMFTRSGLVDVKGPDYMGGKHKIYDLFIAYIDSAYANNTTWYKRITMEMGSRDPEWSADGKRIVFWRDLNANFVNTSYPNYQICTMAPDGSDEVILRKDWQFMDSLLMMTPSASVDGKIAFTAFFESQPQGLVVLDESNFMMSLDSVKEIGLKNRRMINPAFSPDGKWLAYLNNSVSDQGVYIATPDLKERYLVFAPPVSTYMVTLSPSFSPDSKWITFSTTDGSVWICDITGNGARRLTGPGIDRGPAWSKH